MLMTFWNLKRRSRQRIKEEAFYGSFADSLIHESLSRWAETSSKEERTVNAGG